MILPMLVNTHTNLDNKPFQSHFLRSFLIRHSCLCGAPRNMKIPLSLTLPLRGACGPAGEGVGVAIFVLNGNPVYTDQPFFPLVSA